MEPWERYTSKTFALHMLPGDHFFIKTQREILLHRLKEDVKQVIARL